MVDYSFKSWDSFFFCITPQELIRVLDGLHLVRYSGRVPEGYRETPAGADQDPGQSGNEGVDGGVFLFPKQSGEYPVKC